MTDRVAGTEKAGRERLLQELAREAGEAGYCNIPALREYLEAAFEAGRSSGEKWVSVENQPVPADAAVMVTNKLGEICPMIRGIIENWVGVADWTWGQNVTAWRYYPAPPDSGDTKEVERG